MSSSVSPTAQNGQARGGLYASLLPYLAPPSAATIAIVIPFRDFVMKSQRQLQEPVLHIGLKQSLAVGVKAAPVVGGIVGVQMVAQKGIEKMLAKRSSSDNAQSNSLARILASAAVVGVISSPFLAMFNARTISQPALEALKKLTPLKVGAIVAQETGCVAAIAISNPLSERAKRLLGENKAVEYGSVFATGVLGSLAGHPANTALTRWQAGKSVENISQLMRGSLTRARGFGTFVLCYKITNDFFKSLG